MRIDYTPPPTLRRFMLSNAKMRVVMGPFGSGKSSACAMELLRRSAQQEVDQTGKRRTRWVVVRNTMPQLRSTTIKTFLEWFPDGEAGLWRETVKTFFLRIENIEAEIMFRALDDASDVSNLLSLEVTGAWLNECREINPDIVKGILKRVDRYPSRRDGGGPTWAGVWADTNPPEIDSWWYHMMEGELDNDWEVFKQPSGRSADAENIENLAPDYYDTSGYDDEYVKVYIDGQYGRSRAGMPVWPMFNRDLHVAKQPLQPNPDLKLVVGYDAGLTPAAVFLQQDLHGRVLVYDSLTSKNMGSQRFCRLKVKPLLRRKYQDFDVVFIADPAAGGRAQTDEKSVVGVLVGEGLKVRLAPTNLLPPRLESVESFLTQLTDVGPAFIIDPNCRELIKALDGGYHFAVSRTGKTAEKPDKGPYSHPADALQYGCLHFARGAETFARRRRREFRRHHQTLRPADLTMGY